MASADRISRGMLTVNGPIEIVGQQKIRPRRTCRIGEHNAKVLPERVRPAHNRGVAPDHYNANPSDFFRVKQNIKPVA
jgi:hypothetical protein